MLLKNIRKKSRLYSVLFSLFLLIPTASNIQACYEPTEAEELRFMIFNPDLLQNKSWWTFFYNAKWDYLDATVKSMDDETIVAQEWLTEMNSSISVEDARNCLFGGLSDSALALNKFYKEVIKRPKFNDYFQLIRKLENIGWYESWKDDGVQLKAKQTEDSNTKNSIEALLAKEQNSFFQKRYAFLLVKLYYYYPEPAKFNRIYDSYFKNKTFNSPINWWALHYKSMTVDKDSSNYLHSLIFSNSTNKMYASKNYYSSKHFSNILSLAQNNKEKADVYVLKEVINPGRSLNGIQQVYINNPNHKHLPLLIGREINKLEDWLGSTKFGGSHIVTDYWGDKPVMENWKSDYNYLKVFTESLRNMSSLKVAQPIFYDLAMSYLYMMQNEGKKAESYLNKIPLQNPEIIYQVNVLKVILTTILNDIRKEETQNKIGELLEQIISQRDNKFESQKNLYSLFTYLRYSFANKGMHGLAGLCDNYSNNKFCYSCEFTTFEYSQIKYLDQYTNASDIENLIELYHEPDKNKLEKILFLPYPNDYYFLDVLSAKYLREGNLNKALETLNKIPDDFWYTYLNATSYLDTDPFNHVQELLMPQTMSILNKREIVEKMVRLEDDAKANSDKRANNYFLLGNAWYNFSHNSWFMVSYGYGSEVPDEKVFDLINKRAIEYYTEALEYSDSNEFRAKIFYMLTLLSGENLAKKYAKEYENLNSTSFYKKRNCLTTRDMIN